MHEHTFVMSAHLLFFGNSVNDFHHTPKCVYILKSSQQCLAETQGKKLRFGEMSILVFILVAGSEGHQRAE